MKFLIERLDINEKNISFAIISRLFKFKNEIALLEEAQVDGLHFDVMDGQFVPNISIGLPILDAVRSATQLQLTYI